MTVTLSLVQAAAATIGAVGLMGIVFGGDRSYCLPMLVGGCLVVVVVSWL